MVCCVEKVTRTGSCCGAEGQERKAVRTEEREASEETLSQEFVSKTRLEQQETNAFGSKEYEYDKMTRKKGQSKYTDDREDVEMWSRKREHWPLWCTSRQ